MKNLKTPSAANQHERVNDILLGPLERPALKWLVEKMPKWVSPNLLTAVGLIAAVVIFLSYWLTNVSENFLWLASFGFIINWFGDSLDGSLARFRKIERPKFGYFIDHTVDAFTQLLVLLGIGLSPYVSMKFALFFLIGYFLLSIHTYITIYVKQVFKLSYGKFGPTEARVLAILANTVVYLFGIPSFSLPLLAITIYELAFFTVGTALILTFLVSTIKQAVELSVVD